MTIKETIRAIKGLDIQSVRRIMGYVLNMSNTELIINMDNEISIDNQELFLRNIEKLKQGKPLQYIINSQEFMGEKFYVDENVLIPQPDTEVLVEETIKIVTKLNKKTTILDLCTGSGAIAISIKKVLGDMVNVVASDISNKALKVAKINFNNILKEKDRIEFILSDMFENINQKFDIIVSNPPYIESKTIESLPKDVQNQPTIALDGGKDGLDFYRVINKNVAKHLNNEGYLIMEIGYNQKDKLLKILKEAKCIKDYSGNDRVIIWKNTEKNGD